MLGYHSISELPLSAIASEESGILVELEQTIGFTQDIEADLEYAGVLEQTIGFTDSVYRTLEAECEQTIGFSQEITTELIHNISLSQTIGFTQDIDADISIKKVSQTIGFTQEVIGNIEHNIDLVQEIRFTDSQIANGEYNIEICDCIEFNQKASRTYTEELEDTLEFGQNAEPGGLNQTIGFTHSVETNAVQGGCCRDYETYVPNKRVNQNIGFTQSVVALLDRDSGLSQSINFKHTVAYILVEA